MPEVPGPWKWEFEEERKAPPPPPPTPPPPPPPEHDPAADAARFRRRRIGAVLVGGAVLAVAIVAVTGSSGHSGATPAHSADRAAVPLKVVPTAPPEPESRMEGAVQSVRAYTPFVREGGSRGHEVALTFDDGPGPYTPALLSVLEHYHVHGTFFTIGRMERYFSASTAREIRDGDAIGDHTEDHPMMAALSPHQQREEIFEVLARIEFLNGPRPTLFRPPYGSYDAATMHELRTLHLLMVLWSVDTSDWERPGTQAIVQRALAGAHPGAIILLHDGGGDRSETIAALPAIIEGLRRRGLEPVTVPRLMRDDPPVRGQQLPTSVLGD